MIFEKKKKKKNRFVIKIVYVFLSVYFQLKQQI